MPDAPGSQGRDTCPGPGWWLASDNKWYPPEQAPENRATNATKKAGTRKVAKKKVAKKKVAKKKPVDEQAPAETQPATVAPEPTGAPTPYDADFADMELEELTAPPPATEQIAARRIQAKEQTVLLASDRRLAAMRALSSLELSDEQVLVGVGGRSIDARTGSPSAPPPPQASPDEQTVVEPPVAEAPVAAPEVIEPESPAPESPEPESPEPESPAPPPPAPPPDDARPPVEETIDQAPAPTPPPGGFGAGFARHQPMGPQPAATAMGLDAPFMEVRGSALGTDIDKIGEKILIFGDRVELLDRGNLVRLSIPYDQLAGVTITKKMMGPTLEIRATTGRSMSAKSLRPETASGAKAMIEKHAARFKQEAAAAPTEAPTAPVVDDSPVVDESPAVDPEPIALVEPAPLRIAEPAPEPEPAPAPEPVAETVPPVVDEAPPELFVVDDEPVTVVEEGSVGETPPPAPTTLEPAPPATPKVSQAVLIGMLEELAEAGVLTDVEKAEKLALLESLYP